MFFFDMAAVFYAVIFGMLISLFVLLGELTWAARKDKKHNKVNKAMSTMEYEVDIMYLGAHKINSSS